MDFYRICVKKVKGEDLPQLYPDFVVGRTQDLMVRGGAFYAIWDEAEGLWSTDEYAVQKIVDEDLRTYSQQLSEKTGEQYAVKYLANFANGMWAQFRKYLRHISDNNHDLDATLTFADSDVKKTDYRTRRLPYKVEAGDHSAWDELMGTFYSVEERAKIEWAAGSVLSGDSKRNDRFLVVYGAPGTGKGTYLSIAGKLFQGYTKTFNAKALGSSSSAFSTTSFKDNPLVAIQYDGDLSKIEDNTILNLIASHEPMEINEKYKPVLERVLHTMLLMGTNKPVKITDAQSGMLRRLLDAYTTGVKIPKTHYDALVSRTDFELGAIAAHCLEVYRKMGKNHYEGYRPLQMMFHTDIFFNFIEANYDVFRAQEAISLTQAYLLYKDYCTDTGIEKPLPQYKFREELKHYFDEFKDRHELDGKMVRSVFLGFNANQFKVQARNELSYSLVLDETDSILDELLAGQPAQVAKDDGTPSRRWENVKTTLADLDTRELHYVKVPRNHIVIDFDLPDQNGHKSLERNLEAASNFPATYGELSKSGSGVHLHYIYDGDADELAPVFSEGIEIKVYRGDSSLRRRLSKCNRVPVSTISTGLPVKEKKLVITEQRMKSEMGVRKLITRAMQKEFGSTKPSIDFIKKILDDAYESGMKYDVSDMRPKIIAFASNSTNQSNITLDTVLEMKFASENQDTPDEAVEREMMNNQGNPLVKPDDRLVFWDIEVYPNLFVLCWKFAGETTVVRMINPSPEECQRLLKLRLIGFNNRRYDNHILYARILGRSVEELFNLSQRIINLKDHQAMFGEAYGISYCDIYDFSSAANKHSLKWWQIHLHLPHKELNLPWDKPVPKELVMTVVDYCVNDVLTTEVVFDHLIGDFTARQILAELSGLSVNDTTQRHTARIVFGNDRNPQRHFVYTDLSKEFPGYTFVPTRHPKSDYRGVDPSEGGFVKGKPGMYRDVTVYDIASMHPTSIRMLNAFGKYTDRFNALTEARLAIKRGDLEALEQMLDGRLMPFVERESSNKALSDALKTAINIVYGLTSAKFDNPFRDHRNVDNIVAKRGALFMIDMMFMAEEQGFDIIHIKTDSIKVPNSNSDVEDAIKVFGEKYGYTFEKESTYEKFLLVNDAVYIGREDGQWTAVGAQFQHPVVFKTLFSQEVIQFDDWCETKQVTGEGMYLATHEDRDKWLFVGRSGRFVPVVEGGHELFRRKDGIDYAVQGTKGYRWIDAEVALARGPKLEIDQSYYNDLIEKATSTIEKFGDYKEFVS